ncbi:MAG TPA: acyl-CoA dehydrogenase family protein [Vicinamibacterales bacterium]|nr:acyl-CoA dehydrogenase family protein [Vicinamibacterales bacterium]
MVNVSLHDALDSARDIAARVLTPEAAEHDKAARFSTTAVRELGSAGLLGLTLPRETGGLGLGPRAFAGVTAALAEADASAAMVYVMHVLGAATIAAASPNDRLRGVIADIAGGRHLTTLAFSEVGSRSHFWAPVSKAVNGNGAGVVISAKKSFVTSAGHADSYVVSALAPNAEGPTDSTLYLVPAKTAGLSVAGPWDGMGLRANASAPMTLQSCEVAPELQLTTDGAGFKTMLEVVLPLFNLGSAAVALGLCRACLTATASHLKTSKFEHLGVTLGEALPNLRAQLAQMQISTDSLAALVDDGIGHLEKPDDLTMLRVLEMKAAAGETAIAVTSMAMRTCGGAAFSRQTGVDRFFRDAHAGSVMAPTTDVLREFIGKALLGIPLF